MSNAHAGVFRLEPPRPEQLVRWPATFGSRFLVSVDVEEEFDWQRPFSREARATTAIAALPDAAARFARAGVPLTYLVDYPVAADETASATIAPLLNLPGAALGAQLHPWVTPPDDEELSVANSFAGNLPRASEEAKIAGLTCLLRRTFARQPVIFRAGRYGLGRHTTRLLLEHGYRADTSIRAYHGYGAEGGPDFARVGPAAHWRDGLFELPLTTVFTGWGHRGGAELYRALRFLPKGRAVAARTGLLSRVSLTPEGMPLAEAKAAVTRALADGARLLHLWFHSPSLVPGHTPFVPDPAALDRFWRWWSDMLEHLTRSGAEPVSLGEVLAAADRPTTLPRA